jgi:hypothetical protein
MVFEGRDGLRIQLPRHVVQEQVRDLSTNRGFCSPDDAASRHVMLSKRVSVPA